MLALMLSAPLASGCDSPMFRADAPVQKGAQNPLDKMGAEDLAQRQQDCWDMPSAHACYEVGLAYEMGLNGPGKRQGRQRVLLQGVPLGADS